MIFGYSVTYSEVGGQLLVNFMQRPKVAPFNRGSCRINLKRRKVCVVIRKPTSLNSKAFTYNKDIISYKISNHNNSLTTNCFLPSNLFLIVLMRWGVSERTNILRDSSHGWVKNGWHLPLTPLMPRSDHIFRFVVAPSEISPWTIAPTFSSNIIALITIFANSVPLTGPLDAKIAIGWAYFAVIALYINTRPCVAFSLTWEATLSPKSVKPQYVRVEEHTETDSRSDISSRRRTPCFSIIDFPSRCFWKSSKNFSSKPHFAFIIDK